MENLNEKIAEILEVDAIKDEDNIKDFDEWDSLTALSIISMIDADYNINIRAEELASLDTVKAIKDRIKEKMTK